MDKKAKSRIRIVLAVGVLLSCLHGVPTAFAEEGGRQLTVKYEDLNLDSPEGAKVLYTRIHSAAKQVCSQTDPILRMGASSCAAQAESQAIAKVNRQQLTALYREKTKSSPPAPKLVASR